MFFKGTRRSHRMNEVVRGVDTCNGHSEGLTIHHIASHDFHSWFDPAPKVLGVPDQTASGDAKGFQLLQQAAPNIAGGSGQQH